MHHEPRISRHVTLLGRSSDELHRPDRYPLSSRYDPRWVLALDMGPHPLWQLEDLLTVVELRPGQRVLDLACGRGATSVFLGLHRIRDRRGNEAARTERSGRNRTRDAGVHRV
jgi:hypothetical protein